MSTSIAHNPFVCGYNLTFFVFLSWPFEHFNCSKLFLFFFYCIVIMEGKGHKGHKGHMNKITILLPHSHPSLPPPAGAFIQIHTQRVQARWTTGAPRGQASSTQAHTWWHPDFTPRVQDVTGQIGRSSFIFGLPCITATVNWTTSNCLKSAITLLPIIWFFFKYSNLSEVHYYCYC